MSLSSLIAPEVLAALAAAAGPAALIWAPTGRIKRLLAEIEAEDVAPVAPAAAQQPPADAAATADGPLPGAA